MKVVIGSDHGAYELKEKLKIHLVGNEYDVDDIGTFSGKSVDYPDIARDLCAEVLQNEGSMGLLMCGTGLGMSIAANKVPGIRAALCSESYSATKSRQHNNANVLCLGGRTTGYELAQHIVDTFLDTEFEGGRHLRRINKIESSQ
ncbi:MAG: ribose 5-phosphate isomerase B [Deltaproteobacteria bacterium]|jgi:ribose 5-phosphate isomerase B|nr:ribose 5-phosphate isomerase B [Deltaproteobacteria bacterium]